MIKGWKNAGREISKARQAASAAEKRYEVRRLRSDGALSKAVPHPQYDLFADGEEARAQARVRSLEEMNPGQRYAVVDRMAAVLSEM